MNPRELMEHAAYDSEHVRRNTIIQIVIATLAFILLCRVWPFGLIQRHTESAQQAFSSTKNLSGDTFTSTDKKLQTVRFSNEHLQQVFVYLTCKEGYDANCDYAMFRIYDDSFSCIYEETQGFGLLEKNGGFLATPDMDVETGRDYYYEIIIPEEIEGSIILPVADRASLGQEENTILYIDGIYTEDTSLVADFDYTKELTVLNVIGYDLLILVIAVVSYIAIIWLLYYFEDYLDTAGFYSKRVATGIVALSAVGFFVFAVIRNGFGGEIADRFVYGAASLVGVLWFYYAVCMPGAKRKKSKLRADKQSSLIWRNYIQTVSFGLLFYALCQYVNADREYYHYVNTRWMLIFLGIAFLMIYTEKELCNYMSGVWLVAGLIGSAIYCHGIEGEQELYLAKLAAAATVVWGLVIINVLRQVKKDFWKTIYWPFFAVWLVFVIFMYCNRFQKVWVFVATLPFLTMLFMNLSAAGKSRLLKNFTNGILLSFGFVMLFCLMHRPYHYWMRYRYNGIFHTVACTGMYLGVVTGAALAKLYGKWTNGDKLWKAGKIELFLLVASVANILFTMSRTAILTFAVNVIAVVILAAIVYKKELKQIAVECVFLGAAIVISFPLMYSVIRVVPAVVNDPVRYEIEPQERSYMIYEGDKIDSDKYMTIRRYFDVFFGRFQSEEEEAREERMDDMLLAYIGKNTLPVSYPSAADSGEISEGQPDISNGRFEIFSDYIKNLKLGGHEKMALEIEEDSYAHAHNSYIQVAYDFGLIAGAAFLVLCAVTLWKAVMLALHYGRNYSIYFVPFSLIIVFGFTSLTEWAFHPCIPAGFAFLFVQMLLMQKPWSRRQKGELPNVRGEETAQQAK